MSSKRSNKKNIALAKQLFSGKVTRRVNFPSTQEKQPLKLTFEEFPLLGNYSALSEHQDEESVSMSTSDSEEDRGVKRDMDEIESEEQQEKIVWIHVDEPVKTAEISEEIETQQVEDISDKEFADYCEALEEEYQELDDDYNPYPDCNNKYYSQEFVGFYESKIRGNKLVYRKTQKNKKDKVKPGRYINANVQRREKEKEEQIGSELARQKSNARNNVSQTIDCGWSRRGEPLINSKNNNQFGNAVYEKDLQKAMSASRTETHESGLTYAQLMELLSRDLTPEDYDMLLALDTTVQKKTTDTNSIKALKELTATEGHCKELCTVCMCNYDVGDPIKTLPCEHLFHKECITTWLEKHSQSCPLCNAKV